MGTRLEERKIATRYARALFDGAVEAGALEQVHSDLNEVKDLFVDVPALQDYLTNPAIPVHEKLGFIEEQFAGKISDWVTNLLKLMTEANRVEAFGALTEQFQALVNQRDNVATAEVVTAIALDKTLEKKLQKTLETRYGYSRVEIEKRIDPEILGGVIVRIQDQVIDGSFAGRLNELHKQVG